MVPALEDFSIRIAAAGDEVGICEAHYQAIHVTAASDYAPDVIKAWHPPDLESAITATRQYLLNPDAYTVVAVTASRIVGFASFVASASEIRAVYVHPDFGRRGVGTQLLTALEAEAQHRGLLTLRLDSSITARNFYEHHGYNVDSIGTHALSTGALMDCVHMSKRL
jgi:putative acetyltransferase